MHKTKRYFLYYNVFSQIQYIVVDNSHPMNYNKIEENNVARGALAETIYRTLIT